MKTFISSLAIFFITNIAFASSSNYRELEEICKKTRTEKLKVVQAKKIEECVNIKNKEREYCERYYRDYGWGNKTGKFSRSISLFEEIPECIDAFNARKNRNL